MVEHPKELGISQMASSNQESASRAQFLMRRLEQQISLLEITAVPQRQSQAPKLLPRQEWKSQHSFLKALFKAKRALEEAEKSIEF